MAQNNFIIKKGLRVGDSDLYVTSGGAYVKALTVGNVTIPSTIGTNNQILKVESGSLVFASQQVGAEDSDLSKVAILQNKVDNIITRIDSDNSTVSNGVMIIDSDGELTVTTNSAGSGLYTEDSEYRLLYLTGNQAFEPIVERLISLRVDVDSDSSRIQTLQSILNQVVLNLDSDDAKLQEVRTSIALEIAATNADITNIKARLDSDSAAIQSLATKTRTDLDSDSIVIQQLKTATNTNTANAFTTGKAIAMAMVFG
jgi:hypothetical protein|tara:strand:- start:690 stop:1460 length:771 start_codon:yes stop_codon:yes gene_type:complete